MIVALASGLVVVHAVAAAAKVGPVGRAAHRRSVLALVPVRARALGRSVAGAVVAGEWVVVLCLLVGIGAVAASADPVALLPGFLIAAVLALVFTGAHVRALLGRREVRCACFGATERAMGWPGLLRAVLLLGACASGVLLGTGGAAPVGATATLTAGVVGIAVGLLLVHLEDVLDLLGPSTTAAVRGAT